MPYIKKEQREQLDETINALAYALTVMSEHYDRDALKGMVNYSFTKILHSLYNTDFNPHNGQKRTLSLSYSNINDAIGILECIKQEFYIDVARPYEEEKKKENGPVKVF